MKSRSLSLTEVSPEQFMEFLDALAKGKNPLEAMGLLPEAEQVEAPQVTLTVPQLMNPEKVRPLIKMIPCDCSNEDCDAERVDITDWLEALPPEHTDGLIDVGLWVLRGSDKEVLDIPKGERVPKVAEILAGVVLDYFKGLH